MEAAGKSFTPRERRVTTEGKGSRTGSLERMFPTLLETQYVTEVKKKIEEKGLKVMLKVEEILLYHRRRRLEEER